MKWVHFKIDQIFSYANFGRSKPLRIESYSGFSNGNYLYLHGRVLRDRFIKWSPKDRILQNLMNGFKRFYSREIVGATVVIDWLDHKFKLKTDAEGYYELSHRITKHISAAEKATWSKAKVSLVNIPGEKLIHCKPSIHDILMPSEKAKFGTISDIDDTIIQTDVISRFKWRMVHNTFFKNAHSRKSFKEAASFFNKLSHGLSDVPLNPIFYVSNSPWNLYDLILDFVKINQFPLGPILLRDFGLPYKDLSLSYKGHKFEQISRILTVHPSLSFVLIGDSAEKDLDIYLDAALQFPDQIKAIFIRDILQKDRALRIQRLIEKNSDVPIHIIKSYSQAIEYAKILNLIEV